MKRNTILAVIGLTLISVVIAVLISVKTNNRFTELSNKYIAGLSANEAVYDAMWKIIQQEGQVVDKYSSDFRENFAGLMSARNYGGEMMKWIQESNPAFSQDMYVKMQSTIESQRTKFTKNQVMVIDYNRELNNMKMKIPSRWFLQSRVIPELIVVTSTKTEETFKAGKEDNIDLF